MIADGPRLEPRGIGRADERTHAGAGDDDGPDAELVEHLGWYGRDVVADGPSRSIWPLEADYVALDLDPSLILAARHSIYAYDAYVVECARRYQTPLVSLDRRQCEVAASEGVETIGVES